MGFKLVSYTFLYLLFVVNTTFYNLKNKYILFSKSKQKAYLTFYEISGVFFQNKISLFKIM